MNPEFLVTSGLSFAPTFFIGIGIAVILAILAVILLGASDDE